EEQAVVAAHHQLEQGGVAREDACDQLRVRQRWKRQREGRGGTLGVAFSVHGQEMRAAAKRFPAAADDGCVPRRPAKGSPRGLGARYHRRPMALTQRRADARAARSPHAWTELDDEGLLRLRFRDLRLRIEDAPVWRDVERVNGELERRGIRFRPHVWLSESWFSPDGVPGFAVPFFLAHPRLQRLEERLIGEA